MSKRLKTVVVRIDEKASKGGAVPVPGAEPSVTDERDDPALTFETRDLNAGERSEISEERDVRDVVLAMDFTLISPVATADASSGDSWGIAAIGADELDPTAGANAKVAVLDTGIALDHPAFDGLDPVTMNFTDEADEDIDGHGTHCAGTIFGQDVNGQRIGVARGVRKPLIGKVLGRGGGDSSSIFAAINWAREQGAHVVSMSLGIDFAGFRERLVTVGFHPLEATSVALQAYRDNVRTMDRLSALFANAADIDAPLLIAAAGNESDAPNFDIATAPPAAADDVLSVGALTQSLARAAFSNTLPDCAAPGVDIVSAAHTGGLVALSGTSMATPHVAGVAAVRASRLLAGGRFTPRDLREDVMSLARALPGETRETVGRGGIRF